MGVGIGRGVSARVAPDFGAAVGDTVGLVVGTGVGLTAEEGGGASDDPQAATVSTAIKAADPNASPTHIRLAPEALFNSPIAGP